MHISITELVAKKKVGSASHFSFETQKYMLSYEDGVGGGGRN